MSQRQLSNLDILLKTIAVCVIGVIGFFSAQFYFDAKATRDNVIQTRESVIRLEVKIGAIEKDVDYLKARSK